MPPTTFSPPPASAAYVAKALDLGSDGNLVVEEELLALTDIGDHANVTFVRLSLKRSKGKWQGLRFQASADKQVGVNLPTPHCMQSATACTGTQASQEARTPCLTVSNACAPLPSRAALRRERVHPLAQRGQGQRRHPRGQPAVVWAARGQAAALPVHHSGGRTRRWEPAGGLWAGILLLWLTGMYLNGNTCTAVTRPQAVTGQQPESLAAGVQAGGHTPAFYCAQSSRSSSPPQTPCLPGSSPACRPPPSPRPRPVWVSGAVVAVVLGVQRSSWQVPTAAPGQSANLPPHPSPRAVPAARASAAERGGRLKDDPWVLADSEGPGTELGAGRQLLPKDAVRAGQGRVGRRVREAGQLDAYVLLYG